MDNNDIGDGKKEEYEKENLFVINVVNLFVIF